MIDMDKNFSREFVYQVFTLVTIIIVVQAVYVSVIRPNAQAILQEQRILIEQDAEYVPERSFLVIIQDIEQEACFILMFWVLAIMGYKARTAMRERSVLSQQVLPIAEGVRILPADTRGYLRQIDALPDEWRNLLVPRAIGNALRRFGATGDVQDVSSSTHTLVSTEAERLESELSMIRYIAWAIPSIGFIGTVRGIGQALSLAHRAVEGDISGVTESLGVAFNSTFVALLISIIVMFLVYQLQLLQDRLVFESEGYLDQNLIRHLQAA